MTRAELDKKLKEITLQYLEVFKTDKLHIELDIKKDESKKTEYVKLCISEYSTI